MKEHAARHLSCSIVAFTHTHTHTHTRARECKTSRHNLGSECQNSRQLDRQTRKSMSDANRRLSAAHVMGRCGFASWAMHCNLHEAKGSLWHRKWSRSLHKRQQNVKTHLCTRIIWESQAMPLPGCCARPWPYPGAASHTHTHTHFVTVIKTHTHTEGEREKYIGTPIHPSP